MKLLFIGDSFLTGYGVRNGESWYDLVKNETPEEMINRGINGIWGMGKEDYQESLIILKRYRRLITEYCQDENIATIDFAKTVTEDTLQNQPYKVFIDGIHLTQEYHKAVADKFLYKFNYILLKKDPKDYIVS